MVYDALGCNSEWGLIYCYAHGRNAIEIVLCLILTALNYVQLFCNRRIKRSVNTQVELITQLHKVLYLLKYSHELIIKAE